MISIYQFAGRAALCILGRHKWLMIATKHVHIHYRKSNKITYNILTTCFCNSSGLIGAEMFCLVI
uniref:Uncharacterized protein n=1 Tax=Arundo donax TaxID=35708 RepID=A0A0A8YVC2_ARUDO